MESYSLAPHPHPHTRARTYAHTARANLQAASKALEEESPVVSLSEMVSLSARKVHADSAVANQVAAFARG